MSYILRLGQIQTQIKLIQDEIDTLEGGGGSGVNPEVQAEIDNLQTQVDNLILSINSSGIDWTDINPSTIPSSFTPTTHNTSHLPGSSDVIPNATTTLSGLMSNTDKTKLNNIATQATQNSTDSYLLNRTNHTGTQAISTITNLQTSLDAKEPTITTLPITKGGTGNTSINIDNIFYASANNVLSTTPITSYARTLLDDIDAPTFRTTLGLGSIATQNSNSVSITGGSISIPTLNTNAIERSTSGTLNLGVTANNTTVEIGSLSNVINVGTGNVAKTINIGGHSSDVLNITGSVVSQNVTNTNIMDKLITINKGGAVSSADGSGFEIEENALITGYFNIGNTRNSFNLKTPARNGIFQLTPTTASFTQQITSTTLTANRTLTLPNRDINLSSQTQNLVYASPSSGTGEVDFRSLVANDIPSLDTAKITTGTFDSNRLPLATSSLRGAISKEASGTWSPVLEGTTTAGTHTYSVQNGRYTLLGNACFAWCYINITTIDASISGNLRLGGLPFTALNLANFFQTISVSQYTNITFNTGYTQLGGRIDPNSTKILLFQNGSGLGGNVISSANIITPFLILCCGTYIIN